MSGQGAADKPKYGTQEYKLDQHMKFLKREFTESVMRFRSAQETLVKQQQFVQEKQLHLRDNHNNLREAIQRAPQYAQRPNYAQYMQDLS